MRNGILKAGALSIAALLLVFTGTASATGDNAIIVGGSFAYGPDTEASVIMVEYERMLNDGLSVLVRVGNLDYEYDDDWYIEEGDGPGLEAGVRIYPAKNGMTGFFFGAAAGLWFTEWDWKDYGTPFAGTGESTAIDINANVGGKIPLGGSNFFFQPSAIIGTWLGVDDECTYTSGAVGACDKESELGFYAVGNISFGATF